MKKLRGLVTLVSCAILIPSVTHAGLISDIAFDIVASNADGSASLSVLTTSGQIIDDMFIWNLEEPVELIDPEDGDIIGTLEQASVVIIGDPVISLGFVVSSGGLPTDFTITSANLSFTAIPGAVGRASGAVAVTDIGGNGASLTGMNVDGQSYQTFYNDPGFVPATGTTFATLVSDVSTGTPFSSVTSSEDFPVGPGFSATNEAGALLGAVSSISSQFDFGIGASDSASGTSVFVVMIPEPTALLSMLIGVGALALLRRR
jgi:hypothetical protein